MSKKSKRRGERVRVQVGDVQVSLRIPRAGDGAALPSAEWLPFSPTEKRVVMLLIGSQALSRDDIAQKLDESPDGRIKGILATLVARKVILVTPDGYQVNAPEGKRKALKEWFADPVEEERNEVER
jgi:hypothetical protein